MIAMFLNEKNEKNIIFKNYFCVHMPFLIHWIVTAPIGKKWSFNRLNFTILNFNKIHSLLCHELYLFSIFNAPLMNKILLLNHMIGSSIPF
jgi:hypothetical protein